MLINFYTRLCTTLHKFQGLGYKKRAKFTHSFKNSLKKRDDNILRYHFSFYKKNICRKIAQIRFSPFTKQKSTNNVSFFFFSIFRKTFTVTRHIVACNLHTITTRAFFIRLDLTREFPSKLFDFHSLRRSRVILFLLRTT